MILNDSVFYILIGITIANLMITLWLDHKIAKTQREVTLLTQSLIALSKSYKEAMELLTSTFNTLDSHTNSNKASEE